jgi:hypothetical protein
LMFPTSSHGFFQRSVTFYYRNQRVDILDTFFVHMLHTF